MKSKLWGWLRTLFALGILYLVARSLPWRDQLVWEPSGGGEAVSLSGEIFGDWKADQIRFVIDADESVGEGAPPLLVDAAGRPDMLSVDREQEVEGGRFDWKPGMPRAFREMQRGGLLWALIAFASAFCFGITRWWRLLRLAGCPTTWFNTLRLTYLGLFFNMVVPGLTGGDLVKAVLVTREHPSRRAHAVVSVAVDRVIGLVTLALLCAVVVFLRGDRMAELRKPILLFLMVALVGTAVYFNGPLRRLFRVEKVLAALPLGNKLKMLDEAVLLYANHPWEIAIAILLSLGNHFVSILGVYALGQAFGVGADSVGWWDYVALVPVANIVSSLPVAPGGWGIGEAAFKFLFQMIGASATLGVAVSVTFRLTQMALGLLGGLFLLVPGTRGELHAIEEEQL